MSNCADVFFSFGPAYKGVFARNGSVFGNLVYCGYITDYCFKEVREDALKLRERLLDRGAKFILFFFDENSSNKITSVITHEKTTNTYKYFLEQVLKDESLGLILKPGYPTSIYERIAPISEDLPLPFGPSMRRLSRSKSKLKGGPPQMFRPPNPSVSMD